MKKKITARGRQKINLENVQRMGAISGNVPVLFAVFAKQIITCALLEEVPFTDASATERPFVLEQIASEYIVTRAFTNFANVLATARGGT